MAGGGGGDGDKIAIFPVLKAFRLHTSVRRSGAGNKILASSHPT